MTRSKKAPQPGIQRGVLRAGYSAGGANCGGLARGAHAAGHARVRRGPAAGGGTIVVYDDYGHHPTEIEQTLKALRLAEKPERLVCVFQPHQHSRTRFLLDHFAESFASADEVIVPGIYFVRDSEAEKQRVSAVDLVERLADRGVLARHIPEFDDITEYLRAECAEGDLVVIMGAGPVWTIGRDFMADET